MPVVTKCSECRQLRKCSICKEDYNLSPSNTECDRCYNKIKCLKELQNYTNMFYSEVELKIEYNAYEYLDLKCEVCDNEFCPMKHDCNRLKFSDKPERKHLIYQVPKLFKNEDVRLDNSIKPTHSIFSYFKAARLFEGDKIEIVKAEVRPKNNKIRLK